MGNCFVCFKAPNSAGLENSTRVDKEEMPEARLYPAPSHSPPTACLSNGNHLQPLSSDPGVQLAPVTHRFYAHRWSRGPAMGQTETRLSDARLQALYDQYREAGEDVIGAEGIVQLCKDLGVQPEDFRVLVLAWKMNAEQMCRFTRQEFIEGLKSIRADSVKSINSRLPELVAEVESSAEQFKDLYRWTFRFGLEASQRCLPRDMAISLWQLVFTVREPPILQRWLAFLEFREDIRSIQRDTWNMFLNFAETVGSDLSSYDDNEAWPCLLDEFVEHENDQANQNTTLAKDKEDKVQDESDEVHITQQQD